MGPKDLLALALKKRVLQRAADAFPGGRALDQNMYGTEGARPYAGGANPVPEVYTPPDMVKALYGGAGTGTGRLVPLGTDPVGAMAYGIPFGKYQKDPN